MRIPANKTVLLVPVCFKGELSSLRIYSGPSVGACSVYSGPLGDAVNSELVGEFKGEAGKEVETVLQPVTGDEGLWIVTDGNVSTARPKFKAII